MFAYSVRVAAQIYYAGVSGGSVGSEKRLLVVDARHRPAEARRKLKPMGIFESISLASRIWPRLAAIVVVGTLVFAPQFAESLITRAAQERAQKIASLFTRAFESATENAPQRSHARNTR